MTTGLGRHRAWPWQHAAGRQASTDRPRPARQRPSDDIKAARQRLTNGNALKPEFEYELTLMFVRNELAAQATIILLAAIFSLASMFWAPWTQAVIWLVMVIGAKVILLETCRRFQAVPESEIDLKAWKRWLFLAEAFNGMAWAGFALVGIALAADLGPGLRVLQPRLRVRLPDRRARHPHDVRLDRHPDPLRRHDPDDACRGRPPRCSSAIISTSRSPPWRSACTSTSCSWPKGSTRRRSPCSSSARRRIC